MNAIFKILKPTLVALAISTIFFGIFMAIAYVVNVDFVPSKETISYNDVVVLLLTTVTIIFAVAATVLTLVGVWGFKNLIRDARRYAAKAADQEIGQTIKRAFARDGIFSEGMANELREGSGPFAEWLRTEVERQITEQKFLTIDGGSFDENDPTDEGDQV